MKIKRLISLVVLLMFGPLFCACQAKSDQVGTQEIVPSATPATLLPTKTLTIALPATSTPPPKPSSQPTQIPTPMAAICPPFAGYSRSNLEAAVFNPYHPPATGLDGPHQGVDFADLEPTNRYAREGLAIQAVLAGKVAAVINDRFPYGNALMIETSLADIPPGWVEALDVPPVQPPQTPHPALTCPDLPWPDWDLQTRSLYLLYAHMQQTPQLGLDETVSCGQIIGAVGSSGNALNPHLHLEIRVGPSEARFDSLAHYDTSARPEEMANYCTWRVRGIFQLIDPILLIEQIP